MKELYVVRTQNSFDVPVFTCLTRECRESEDTELSQVFDCDNYYVGLSAAPNCAHRMVALRRRTAGCSGLLLSWGSWFTALDYRKARAWRSLFHDNRHFKLSVWCPWWWSYRHPIICFWRNHLQGWRSQGMTIPTIMCCHTWNGIVRS